MASKRVNESLWAHKVYLNNIINYNTYSVSKPTNVSENDKKALIKSFRSVVQVQFFFSKVDLLFLKKSECYRINSSFLWCWSQVFSGLMLALTGFESSPVEKNRIAQYLKDQNRFHLPRCFFFFFPDNKFILFCERWNFISIHDNLWSRGGIKRKQLVDGGDIMKTCFNEELQVL